MRNTYLGLIVIALVAATIDVALAESDYSRKVASQGATKLLATFDKDQIVARIVSHEVNIGKTSDPRPEKIESNCTYSRFPCSLIDDLEIVVNGNALFVPRSVYSDLADVVAASIHREKRGRYALTFEGGDASESYSVEITFDERRVKQREVRSNEARQVMQRTIYFASPSVD